MKTEKQAPLTQHQQEPSASVSRRRVDKKSMEPHVTHSFTWCYDKTTFLLTCDEAGTIEEVLRRSTEFKEVEKTNSELVVIKNGNAISSHFPCSLIKDENLTVGFVKMEEKQSDASGAPSLNREQQTNPLVTFHVLTKGGKNVQRVMKNRALAENVLVTVYAYKGEKVTDALERDGRFMSVLLKAKICALSQINTKVTVEMSNFVDHLDGKTFQIVQLKRSATPASLYTDKVKKRKEPPQLQEPAQQKEPAQQSTSAELEKVDKLKPVDDMAAKNGWCKTPDLEKLWHTLTSLLNKVVKAKKGDSKHPTNIQKLFRVEFGKNAQACNDVKTMKKMMERSDSVCLIKYNQEPEGTGFLLFDNFVLTNGHVLKNIYNVTTGQLSQNVRAHFFYGATDQTDSPIEVTGVVGCEWCTDEFGKDYDWALLELRKEHWEVLKLNEDPMFPSGLLQHFLLRPQSDGICIIGYPGDGGIKKIDTCFVVPTEKHMQVLNKHHQKNPGIFEGYEPGPIMMLTHNHFKDNKSDAVTYVTCFYYSSSGSPVFDKHGNVGAMHTGGFVYENEKDEKDSVIEYGYPTYVIVQRLLIKLVSRQDKSELLERFLTCCKQNVDLRNNLIELVGDWHLRDPEKETVKKIFEFLHQAEEPEESLTEEPVSMDTGLS
ncbi:uncharacterized protein V6R79_005643 [Siganus canaliculatus]